MVMLLLVYHAHGFNLNVEKPPRVAQTPATPPEEVEGPTYAAVHDDLAIIKAWAEEGRRLHEDRTDTGCNTPGSCCPYHMSNQGGTWSYLGDRAKNCDHGCNSGCDESGWSCNTDCASQPPRRAHSSHRRP